MSRGMNLRNSCLTMHDASAMGISPRLRHQAHRGKILACSSQSKRLMGFVVYGWWHGVEMEMNGLVYGCVEVVGCLKCEELVCRDEVPEGVRLEGQRDFCWLFDQPQIYEAAVRGLCPDEGPLPVKFPLPDPSDPFSLRPGSLASYFSGSKGSENERSQSLNAAIAGARAAATQFSKKGQSNLKSDVQNLPSTGE
ncbi:hypothetical protein AAC387_Pa01g1284 [Persea americana]